MHTLPRQTTASHGCWRAEKSNSISVISAQYRASAHDVDCAWHHPARLPLRASSCPAPMPAACNASQFRISRNHRYLHVRSPRPASSGRDLLLSWTTTTMTVPRGYAQPASGSWLSRAEHCCSFVASVGLNQHPYDSIQPPGILFIPTSFSKCANVRDPRRNQRNK